MRKVFFLSFVLLQVFLLACNDYSFTLSSVAEQKDSSFFANRRSQDTDRKQILGQFLSFYSGGEACDLDPLCPEDCAFIFDLSFDVRDCRKLTSLQVTRFKTLYQLFLEKDLSALQKINIFDLKAFLNFSPEPIYRSIRTLGPFFKRTVFTWLALNWQSALVFSQEDGDFLFLDIFFNERGGGFPISALREELTEGQNFVQLAWLKQNDPALLWLDNYIKKDLCLGEDSYCAMAKYCGLSEVLPEDFLAEFIEWSVLKNMIQKLSLSPGEGLKDLCSGFCSSQKGQNYCL